MKNINKIYHILLFMLLLIQLSFLYGLTDVNKFIYN